MLKTLLSPLTSAGRTGTTVRDIVMLLGAILAMLGGLGILSAEQVEAVKAHIAALTSPEMLAAIGTVMAIGVSIYRNVTKTVSERAAEAAKQIDKQVPDNMTVVIKTPAGQQDIVVPASKP